MIQTETLPEAIRKSFDGLRAALDRHESLVVAFSGGVDSSLLAFVAHEVLADRMMAVMAVSASLAGSEKNDAIAFLDHHTIPYEVIETDEIENEAYAANNPDRCYHCKSELFEKLNSLAEARGYDSVAHGANVDDRADYRPGTRAADEKDVAAPFMEAGMGKDEIRELAKALELPLWDKPASPCLASRIPYFESVNPEKLFQIDRAESVLKEMRFRVCRVRHHGKIARIELPEDEQPRLFEEGLWTTVVASFKAIGFEYVTLDLEGFRSGRLNDEIDKE